MSYTPPMKNLRICTSASIIPRPRGDRDERPDPRQAQAGLGMDVTVYCVNHEAGRRPSSATARSRSPGSAARRGSRSSTSAPGSRRPAKGRGRRPPPARPEPDDDPRAAGGPPAQPVVVTYQSDVIRQRVRGFLFRPLERLAYRRVRSILQTSPLYADGSAFLRPYATGSTSCPTGSSWRPTRPVAEPPGRRPSRSAGAPRADLAGLRAAGLLQGVLQRDPGPGAGRRDADHRRRRAGPEAAGGRGEAAGRRRPRRLPGQPAALPRHHPLLPRGRRLLVPLERPERGVRDRPGRGDGLRLPGDQRGDPAQRRRLGQPRTARRA